jgi:LDH2 family malate/lactate/ureidoglycolate dehydrogenase
MADRFAADQLIGFARQLFERAGLDPDKAATTATLLVEADLMGHTTHGLQQAGDYLEEIEAGNMARSGEPEVIADRGAVVTWDGRRLPGLWLTAKALDFGIERARRQGMAAVVIRRSAHIGCWPPTCRARPGRA